METPTVTDIKYHCGTTFISETVYFHYYMKPLDIKTVIASFQCYLTLLIGMAWQGRSTAIYCSHG